MYSHRIHIKLKTGQSSRRPPATSSSKPRPYVCYNRVEPGKAHGAPAIPNHNVVTYIQAGFKSRYEAPHLLSSPIGIDSISRSLVYTINGNGFICWANILSEVIKGHVLQLCGYASATVGRA